MITLDQHLRGLDEQEAKEEAIELLAEQMSCAASSAIAEVLRASAYEFSHKEVNNNTNGSDEFNELYYSIAEKLINTVG